MIEHETQATWQLVRLNWLALGAMAPLLLLCLAITSFSLDIDSLLFKVVLVPGMLTAAGHGLLSLKRQPDWAPSLAFALLAVAQLEVMILLVTPLTYVAAAANLPIQDANLARLDQLLGLDWRAYYRFLQERPVLTSYVYIGYAMITWPAIGVPLLLASTRHYLRLQQFILACILTLVATALISSLVPAIGTYSEYGIAPDVPGFRASGYLVQLHELPLIRDGSLRKLDFNTMDGIITFPSFHAAAAVLSLWAFWVVWWMRPLALIANVGMLLATPLVGGHYFVDVIAGAALAVLAIAAAGRVGVRPGSSAVLNLTRDPAPA
jgi:membrane-associated phospholipid phosphatase